MGYNNDQFFNISTAEGPGSGSSTTFPLHHSWNGEHANNPPFVYPSRAVRYLDERGNLITKTLKRGYIRSLTTSVQGQDFNIQKCQFQFNPQTITHDVSLANSYYDVLHQPPEQFTQPMPGGVNFTFTLLFDRSMEVNNPALGFNRVNEANPWELSDPSQVGVLRDLQAFYAVIGQGISEAQKDFLVAKLQNTATLEARRRQTDGDELQQGDVDSAVGNASDYIGQNVGNNAFLIPVPVRVMFSSLYMVEGIVTNTNTELLKFNTSMVPMIAKVTVSMEAKYVGFAREKTYLTEQLAKTVEAYEQEQQEVRDQINSTAQALTAGVGTVQMAFGSPNAVSHTGAIDGPYPEEKGTSISQLLEDPPGDIDYRMYFRVPNVHGNDDNVVTKMFEDGESVSIGVWSTISLYGPYTAAESSAFRSSQSKMIAACTSDKLLLKARGLLAGSGVATDKSSWTGGARGSSSDAVKTTKQVADVETKYFISRYEVQSTILINGEATTGFADVCKAHGPGFSNDLNGLEYTVSIGWPRATTQDGQVTTTTGTLAGDNTATDPKPAGSTSKVGATPPTDLRVK